MAKTFQPTPGAQGFRLSIPSALDLASLSGAQLSVLLRDDQVLAKLNLAMDCADIVMDQCKPNVIRIAPVPLYNTFSDVFQVVGVLRSVLLQ